jgi:hypothetical protein
VQRVLALVLLSVIGFPSIAPAFAAGAESQLPACCRANGKHKCLMHRAAAEHDTGQAVASLSDRCPYLAAPASTAAIHPQSIESGRTDCCAVFTREAKLPAESEARSGSIFHRTHPKRGPPALLS